jgi:hypothetical protein
VSAGTCTPRRTVQRRLGGLLAGRECTHFRAASGPCGGRRAEVPADRQHRLLLDGDGRAGEGGIGDGRPPAERSTIQRSRNRRRRWARRNGARALDPDRDRAAREGTHGLSRDAEGLAAGEPGARADGSRLGPAHWALAATPRRLTLAPRPRPATSVRRRAAVLSRRARSAGCSARGGRAWPPRCRA